MPADTATPPARADYRVLARKYRPARFSDLIGQEAMVRTLSNALAAGRLAHAFMLTGVRGVGKTTTARLIARALNCVGEDGKGGPTIDPCGVCAHCVAIAEDRDIDVIEMDAASRTGIDDIRDLIDGVRYRPVSARYKVYIVDEIHMLSGKAFNALLKTLEEPPEHVKFVFATTEIRKVPITVLSRCQRFDLRRVDQATLAEHLQRVAEKEGRALDAAAAALIARAADGSVRDGLSLLDRALAHIEGAVEEAETRALLGLADRTYVFELFATLMKGDAPGALERLERLYRDGADPLAVVQDLLDVTQWLSRIKIAPEIAADPMVPEAERTRGRALAEGLSLPALTRTWTMLLKGYGEIQAAPQPVSALEMLAIRLCYAATLPSPAELVQSLGAGGVVAPAPTRQGGGGRGEGGVSTRAAASQTVRTTPEGNAPIQSRRQEGAQALAAQAVAPRETSTDPSPDPRSFEDVVALFAERREGILHAHLLNSVHLVRFEPGRIELRPGENAPRDLAARIMEQLQRWTGRRWVVALSREQGRPTLGEQEEARRAEQKAAASLHPLVHALLDAFPGATIEAVRGPALTPASSSDTTDGGEAIDESNAREDEG
ncbi:MAG TPA: DNA polymerase III subunit gamma/tau [Alphaproteobacteria bacterium]|nr:DNA polymerase III subunit gamma/tau [Alphaproteobacteria bacterium]